MKYIYHRGTTKKFILGIFAILMAFFLLFGWSSEPYIFDTSSPVEVSLQIPMQEYQKAQKRFQTGELSFGSDEYFPGATLSWTIGSRSGICEDTEWRPGGQSRRQMPNIQKVDEKQWITATTYKLKFDEKCLGVKKLKMEYYANESVLQKNLSIQKMYAENDLITTKSVAGYATVNVGNISSGRMRYSFDESFDEDFLEDLLPDEELGGWLFRVNIRGLEYGSLNPMSETESNSLIGIESDDGKEFFIYDLKTNKDELAAGRERLLNFVNDLQAVKQRNTKLSSIINLSDLVKMTAINHITGNVDDYATQGNNYYLYFSPNNSPVIIFGVDFDRIAENNSSREYMISEHPSALYEAFLSDDEAQQMYQNFKASLK